MSISVSPLAETALAGQAAGQATKKKPPRHRVVVARADATEQPEAR